MVGGVSLLCPLQPKLWEFIPRILVKVEPMEVARSMVDGRSGRGHAERGDCGLRQAVYSLRGPLWRNPQPHIMLVEWDSQQTPRRLLLIARCYGHLGGPPDLQRLHSGFK